MARKRAASVPSSPDEAAWSLEANPALRELLDHIARQLADEYVRLMKQAAEDEVRAEAADEEGGQ